MDPKLLAIITLRSAALAATLAGRQVEASALYALADAIEAGRVVDATMAAVAEKLKSRELTDADWTDVTDRINADAARLHGG